MNARARRGFAQGRCACRVQSRVVKSITGRTLGRCLLRETSDVPRHLLLPILLLAACAASPVGEVGREACTNRVDDDHDTLLDCLDPDCQNLDICRSQLAPTASGLDAGKGSGGTGVINPPPPTDSGKFLDEDAGFGDDEDGGALSILDAGPRTCDPACPATEECDEGVCTPVATDAPAAFALTILSANAENMSVRGECYDEDPCIIYVCGACVIDPYVKVVRVLADTNAEKVIGMTTFNNNTTSPTFDDPAMQVELSKGDALRFEVWDHNEDRDDGLLFSCKPDLRVLMSGPIGCQRSDGTVLRRLEVNADLQAQ